MRFKVIVFIALFLAILFQYGQSYSLLGFKWPNATFNYYINPANSDVSLRAAIRGVKSGENKWGNWCTGVYKGRVSTQRVSNNGKNTVFFRPKKSGLAIATTYIYYSGNRILDFDMVFWDGGNTFFGTADTCRRGFYIVDIAAHEFGHTIGIDHSNVLAATMYPTASYCNTSLRTLAQDDKSAANAIY